MSGSQSHRSLRFSDKPPEDPGGESGNAASSRKATMTYPTRTMLAATMAEMADGVEEPDGVSEVRDACQTAGKR